MKVQNQQCVWSWVTEWAQYNTIYAGRVWRVKCEDVPLSLARSLCLYVHDPVGDLSLHDLWLINMFLFLHIIICQSLRAPPPQRHTSKRQKTFKEICDTMTGEHSDWLMVSMINPDWIRLMGFKLSKCHYNQLYVLWSLTGLKTSEASKLEIRAFDVTATVNSSSLSARLSPHRFAQRHSRVPVFAWINIKTVWHHFTNLSRFNFLFCLNNRKPQQPIRSKISAGEAASSQLSGRVKSRQRLRDYKWFIPSWMRRR